MKCPRCGKEASVWGRDLISGLCNECIKADARETTRQHIAQQEELARAAAELARAAHEQAVADSARQEQRVRDQVIEIKRSILRRLEGGLPVIIYHSIYLPVDSVVLDEPLNRQFGISNLFQLGLQGWEAIQVIHRTVGMGLKNTAFGSTTGVTWGGGSGGNVMGVYVLLRRTLGMSDVDVGADDELARVIQSHVSNPDLSQPGGVVQQTV